MMYEKIDMEIDIKNLMQSSIKLEAHCSGIYFLFNDDELVYVGRGWNCLLRIAEHTRKESDKIFTSWNYLPVENEEEYRILEKELVRIHNPKYNKVYKNRSRCD